MAQTDWRPVPGFPDLMVTREGRVKRLARTVPYDNHPRGNKARFFPEQELNPYPLNGYVCVFYSARRTTLGVHNLLCRAFHGEPPPDKPFALHRDGVKHHNDPDNLYWGDAFDNAKDAIEHGVMARGEDHGLSKLTEEDVHRVRKECVPGDPELGYGPLARALGVSPAAIKAAYLKVTWQHV